MNTTLISTVVSGLLSALPEDIIKRGVDALLDVAEDAVADSENKIDDAIVLPLVGVIRSSLDIPDDIGGDED